MAAFMRQSRKFVAIGRNYTMTPEPFFFLKPTSSYISFGGKVEIPSGISLTMRQADADSHVAGYALAVDMTVRNMQDEAKKRGLPWSLIPRKNQISNPHNLGIAVKINGAFKQNGTTADMIFKIPRLIEPISSIMTLKEGDLTLIGTPSGVGPVSPGDKVGCTLADSDEKELSVLDFVAVAREGGYQFVPK
ncbi:hypothetical protein R3P38DRAFT_3004248 [Favolaschia claudopus]|uniref:Fumarylacetoacetase-like C-terminal domain-containing protein n=1 Tax=Favolaschia claudopus TaxID=2862362 RepID=A0AAW0AL46_9AGAR